MDGGVAVLLLFNTTRTASGRCCCCSTQRAQPPDPLKHGGRYRYVMVLLLFNTTRARAWSRHAPDPQALDRNVNVQRRAESFRVDMRVSVPAAARMTVVTYMSVPSPSYFSYSCFPLS